MSRLYGSLKGAAAKVVTRRGHRELVAHAASWAGAIRVRVYVDKDDVERFEVEQVPWKGTGESYVLASGVMGKAAT